jgi:PKD repeat protein
MNTDTTFDGSLKSYILKNAIIPPESLTFDARDVVSINPVYSLSDVLWKISNSKTTEERRGQKISIEFNQPLRYTIEAIYTFKKSIPGEKDREETIKETIVVDIERRSLMPRMSVSTTSDYVPTLATVDASQSESETGEIKKFIFDFGEGRPPAEGDSIKQYTYKTSGEKTITLTIISETGEKTSIKKTIVLKDEVKSLDFTPSIQP